MGSSLGAGFKQRRQLYFIFTTLHFSNTVIDTVLTIDTL